MNAVVPPRALADSSFAAKSFHQPDYPDKSDATLFATGIRPVGCADITLRPRAVQNETLFSMPFR